MKILKLIALLIVCFFFNNKVISQNILLNILTHDAGIVHKNGIVFLEISICNTDASDSVAMFKLKPQISVPEAIAIVAPTGHILPVGWTITSNTGSTIRLSNGTDKLPASQCRTILIAIKGKAIGGPSTISANLLFSNGEAPGSATGGPTTRDNPADNTSTSTCEVVN